MVTQSCGEIKLFETGIDIEEVKRFEKYSLEDDSAFLKTIFSQKELDYCFSKKNYAQHLAARFCAKEAFYKCVSGMDISWKFPQIEILNASSGKPYLNLPGKFGKYNFSLSLSHTKTYACAVVILMTD